MKNKPLLFGATIAALLALFVLSPRTSAQFAPQFWDGPHNDNTTIEGGTGTWNTTNLNWANAQGVGGNVYVENSPVIFSGATGLVTLGSNITLNANSVSFSTDGYVINPNGFAFDVVTSVTISVDNGLKATINAPINGAASLTKSGAGTLILSGVNTYTGITTINGGVLSISQDANLGAVPAGTPARAPNQLTFNGGTLQATASFTLNANRGVTLNAGGGTFDVTGANVLTYNGVITGPGNLTKVGTGTLTLAGVNTYTGITSLNGGVLSISQDANLGAVPAGTPAPAPNQLTFNGGTLQATASFTLNANRSVTLNAGGGTFDVTDANVLAYNGVVTGPGNLTKVGTGTLTLAGVNTYGGMTTANAGVLRAGSKSGFSQNSAFTVNTGAVLDLNGFDNTVGSLSGSGVVSNTGGGALSAATLSVGADNTSTIFTGTLLDGVSTAPVMLALNKVGTGTLTLTGANNYSGGTTITAGTLQLGDGGTTGSIIGNVTDNGVFAVNRSDTYTFAGVISGIGSFEQRGTGTTILIGNSTYLGGTTITAGTLQLGNGGTAGSITGDVTDNGVFAVNRSDTYTFPGAISGPGSFEQRGIGTTILIGNSTYIGGTTITAGTLQIGNGGTTGSITGDITNNGILAFDRSNVLTFSGVITGMGSVQQNGTGTTVLTGDSTYIGGTTINAGTLQLGNGGTTGSIVGNVVDNGALIFNRSNTLTFSGVISGTGTVQQNGTGTTVLVSDNTYAGMTTVNAGSLIVDGSIASAQTLVNAGGLLGGKGLIGGNLVNSGIVSPGNSPGALTVSDNYTQNTNGTLRIEIAGLLTSQHDLLVVGGHASLGGTLQLIPLNGFQLHVGDKVTFLTAKGGVSGNFSTVQNEFATIVKTQIIILPTSVELEGTQGSFVSAACNSNTAAVARSLDSAVGDPRAAGLINFLDSEPFSKLCSDFTLIAPEQLTSVFNIGVSLANVQTANLERRMDDVRAGSTGFSGAGFTLNGSSQSFSGGLSGPTGAEGKAGPSVLAPIPENRWGVFATGLGEFTHVDSTDVARGFDLQTGGFTLGVDYRVCPYFAVGLIAGYAHTNADLANGGNLDVNSGKFGLYATAFSGGFYLDTAVTGGISGYDTHRAALLGTASGSTNGGDLNVLVNGGYDWKKGNLSIGPTASFQYTYVSFDGFTESGSLAPLKFNDQHVDSIRTAFGGKASYDWKVGHVLVRPELRAAWQHEYGNSAYSITASFANGAGSSFTVTSPKIGRDSLLLGAGVAVLWTDRISTYIYYDGELGRTNYESNNVSAGIRVTF
jgi:outer membrane autotransporter protein